jgi:hypothetical protein
LPSFSDFEVPVGTLDGVNTVFTLTFAPSPAGSLMLFRNGLRLEIGQDYQIAGSTITFFLGSVPQPGDLLVASYRYANPSNPLSTLASPQVVCSATGGSTSATALTPLGSCTIPAGLLGAGDRLEVEYQYGHVGSAVGFTGEVHIGGTTVVSRSAAAGEGLFAGRTSFGIYSGGETFDTQSWGGSSVAFLAAAGGANEDVTQALTISLRGMMASTTTDSLALRSFTVIRYPAQSNP